MMQRRGHVGTSGLLGQSAVYGAATGRAVQGGAGLLGVAPGNSRMLQQQRSHQAAAIHRRSVREQHVAQQRGLLEQPDVYRQGAYAEQPMEEDYYGTGIEDRGYVEQPEEYVDQQADYYEEPVYEEPSDVAYEEAQLYDYNHGQRLQTSHSRQPQQQRGLLEQPSARRGGLLDEPRVHRSQVDEYVMEEERSLLGRPGQVREQLGGLDYQRQQRNRGERRSIGDRPGSRGNQRSPNVATKPLIPDIPPPVVPRALIEDTWEPGLEDPEDYRETEDRGRLEPRSQPSRGYMEMQREDRGISKREGRGLMATPMEQRGLLDIPREQRGLLDVPQEELELMDSVSEQRALMEKARGLMEAPRDNMGRGQRGLLNTPRDQRGLLDKPREMKSLLDTPPDSRGLLDIPGERRGSGDMQRGGRGLLENPRAVGPTKQQQKQGARQTMQGMPGSRQGTLQLSPGRQQTGGQQGTNKRNRNRQGRNKDHELQLELMEKAGLQLMLLEEQHQKEEMERMTLLQQQQQAILMQHQQQHLQQLQQQQQMQQLQQQQLYQQQQQAKLLLSQEQRKSIPSILDVPTKGPLGKRPGGPSRSTDNKRPRTGQEERKRGNELAKRDGTHQNFAERQRRQRERNRGLNRNRDRRSPANKKHDRRDSAGSKSSSRKTTPKDNRDNVKEKRGETKDTKMDTKVDAKDSKVDAKDSKVDTKDSKVDKGKPEKEKPVTAVTIDLLEDGSEKYDPANPTPDITSPEEKKDVKPVETAAEMKDEAKAGDAIKEETKTEEEKTEDMKEVKEEVKTEDKEKDGKQKEISLTVTVNRKGRSVADGDKKGPLSPVKQKKYKCNVCSVECYDEESFSRHMNGKKHKLKMQLVMTSSSHQALLIKTRMQAEEHLRQIENKKKGSEPKGKGLETHCKTCDKMFTGAYKDHKESPGHKAREDRSKAGCKICNVTTFNTFMDFTKHLQSDWHRKNKQRLKIEEEDDDLGDLVTLDTVGFEEDNSGQSDKKETEGDRDSTLSAKKGSETDQDTFVEPLPPGKEEVSSTATASTKPLQLDITPVKSEEEVIPEKYDSKMAVGQKYVVQVSGFFCKLCSKFYINETSAKINHCQSQTHYEKLKKMLASKASAKTQEKGRTTKTTEAEECSKPGDEIKENTEEDSKARPVGSEVRRAEKDNQSAVVMNGNQAAGKSNMEVSNYETADEHQDGTVTVTVLDKSKDQSKGSKKKSPLEVTISINEGEGKKRMETDSGDEQKSQDMEEGDQENSQEEKEEEDSNQDEEGEDIDKTVEEKSEDMEEEEAEKSQEGFITGKSTRGKQQRAKRGGAGRGRRGKRN